MTSRTVCGLPLEPIPPLMGCDECQHCLANVPLHYSRGDLRMHSNGRICAGNRRIDWAAIRADSQEKPNDKN